MTSKQRQPPLDELQWRSPEWINAFGLRTDNVLEYFSESPFFDRTSNNQVLKMQSQFNENLKSMDLSSQLKQLKGVEFVLSYVREPDFWVIKKQNRLSPDEVQLLGVYYVVGANVYAAPSLQSIISSRLASTVLATKTAMAAAQKLPIFTPSDGYSYITQQETEGGFDTDVDKTVNKSDVTSPNVPPGSTPSMANESTGGSNTKRELQDKKAASAVFDMFLANALKGQSSSIDSSSFKDPSSAISYGWDRNAIISGPMSLPSRSVGNTGSNVKRGDMSAVKRNRRKQPPTKR